MKRTASILVVLFGIVSFACSDAPDEAAPSPEPTPLPELAALDERVVIPGAANIFAAGRTPDELLAAGGGTLPPGWELPDGAGIVTFPSVTGGVAHIPGGSERGPEGRGTGSTDVESHAGISGIVHGHNIMFLVGVFLTDDPPSDPAPPRLNVTEPSPTELVAPRIGQVFLIGDGKDYRYIVPPGATRLFVGFADACDPNDFVGPPGCYHNNSGGFEATVDVTDQ